MIRSLTRCLQRGGGLARSPAFPWPASAPSTAAAGPLLLPASMAATKPSTPTPSAPATYAFSALAVGALPAASPTMLGVKAATPASSALRPPASALLRHATTFPSLPAAVTRQHATAVPLLFMIDVEGLGLPSASTHHTQAAVLVMMLEGVPAPTATALLSSGFHTQSRSSVRPLTGAASVLPPRWTSARRFVSPFISSASQRRHYSSIPSDVIAYERDEYSSMSPNPALHPVDFIEAHPPVWVIPYETSLIGEIQSPAPQLMFRDEGKLLSQSLLQELHGLHLKGYCLYKPPSLDDLVVTALGRMELKDGILIVATKDPSHLNFDWTDKVRLKPPRDTGHLYQLLDNPALPKGYNAVFHSSLLPLHARSQAFMDVNDLVINALPARKARNILKELQDASEWAGVLQGNWFLKYWFQDYRNKDGTYSFPDLTGRGMTFMLQQGVIRCHIYDHRNLIHYTKDEVEFLLHNKNPLLLPRLHHRLMHRGHLGLLKPDRLFQFATCRVSDV